MRNKQLAKYTYSFGRESLFSTELVRLLYVVCGYKIKIISIKKKKLKKKMS